MLITKSFENSWEKQIKVRLRFRDPGAYLLHYSNLTGTFIQSRVYLKVCLNMLEGRSVFWDSTVKVGQKATVQIGIMVHVFRQSLVRHIHVVALLTSSPPHTKASKVSVMLDTFPWKIVRKRHGSVIWQALQLKNPDTLSQPCIHLISLYIHIRKIWKL